MSTFVDFVPSVSQLFKFSAQLGNVQCTVSCPFNVFSQRYFLSVTDSAGNPILYRSLTPSGPQFSAALSFVNSTATVQLSEPHNVPIGTVVNGRIYGTDTSFDGTFSMLATDTDVLTYLIGDFGDLDDAQGTLSFDTNLLAGYNNLGTLLYHYESSTFEYF